MPTPTRQNRANAVRFLSMDAVQKAKSGHPGMPMGMAEIAEAFDVSVAATESLLARGRRSLLHAYLERIEE